MALFETLLFLKPISPEFQTATIADPHFLICSPVANPVKSQGRATAGEAGPKREIWQKAGYLPLITHINTDQNAGTKKNS